MKLGLGFWLSGTAAQGGVVSLEPLTRLHVLSTFGSSSFAATGKDSTLDEDNNATPVFWRGNSMQDSWRAATLPHDAGGSPIIADASTSGLGGAAVLQNIQDAADAGTLANRDIIYQFGGNHAGQNDAVVWSYAKQADAVATSNAGALPTGNIVHYVAGSGDGFMDVDNWRMFYRHQKRLKASPDPGKKGVIHMDEATWAWDGTDNAPAKLTSDTEWQRLKISAHALQGFDSGNTIHKNGMGYEVMSLPGKGIIRAWSGGPAFFPLNDYFGRVTGAGQYIDDLRYLGSLTGCTITTDDSRFTVTNVGGVPKLYLTGAAPTEAISRFNIIVAKSGCTTNTCPIRAHVSSRAINGLPVGVSVQNRLVYTLDAGIPPFASTARSFCAVFIEAFSQDDGSDPTGGTAGGSDSRNHYIFTGAGMNFFRNASAGKWQWNGVDSASATVFSSGAANGPVHKVQHGRRALFIWYDSDAAIGKWYCTAGIGQAAQGPTNFSTINGGNGTINCTASGLVNMFSQNNAVSTSAMLQQYFRGTHWLTMIAMGQYVDFSVSGNRALFCTETAAEPTMDKSFNTAITTLGLTPQVFVHGDGAEIMAGAFEDPSDYDAVDGGGNGLNQGTGPNFLAYLFGTTTRYGNLTNV